MGYDIYLTHADGQPVSVERHREGTILELTRSGLVPAEISVTYNYNDIYELVTGKTLKQILQGSTGKQTIPILSDLVDRCGTRKHKDHWAPTPGNAGSIAALLLHWATLNKEAIWNVQ